MNLINKEKFIAKLNKEIQLYQHDLDHIEEWWDRCEKYAKEIFPQIPNVSILATRKKRLEAYRKVSNMISNSAAKFELDKDAKSTLGLILLYSSVNYKRAYNGYMKECAERTSPPLPFISKFLLFLMFTMMIFTGFVTGNIDSWLGISLSTIGALFVIYHV